MKCEGCGIEIQTLYHEEAGYLPENIVIERSIDKEPLLCQRCFKLKHYNQLLPIEVDSNFYSSLSKVVKDFNTVIYIVDIIDFDGTFRDDILKKLENKNIILVVNKIDLLPKNIPYNLLKDWIYKRVRKKITIKKENIRMISTLDNFGINRLKKIIVDSNEKKVLIVGVTNTGKSSIINKLVKSNFTVSAYPGTTLKTLEAVIQDTNIKIYDTPGIEPNDRFCDLFDIYSQVKMIPKKQINISKFNVEPGRIIFISKLIHFKITDFARDGLRPIFTVFATDNVKIHETKEEKLNDLTSPENTHLTPPYNKDFDYAKIEFETIKISLNDGEELSIPGLGWVNVIRGPLRIQITRPKNILFLRRNSMLKLKEF